MFRIAICWLIALTLTSLSAQNNKDGDALTTSIISDNTTAFLGSPELEVIAAGDAIEGDFHISPAFQPSSNLCWVAHRTTSNISVVDVENANLERVIETGAAPTDIAFSDQYGLVACLGSGELQVFDLSTYTMVKSFDLPGQPMNVEVSSNNGFAIIAMDEVDQAVVINLSNLEIIQTFNSFPIGIGGFSFITSNTRNHYTPSAIAISPSGGQIVTGAGGPLQICDVLTGICINVDAVQNALQVGYSEDGQFLIAVSFGADGVAYKIDPADGSILSQVAPKENINFFNGKMALSLDGNRLMVPSTNSGMYIRFDHSDYSIINTNSAVFWTHIRKDRNVALAGGFNTYLIDMATGKIKGSTSGISLMVGAIADDGSHMLAMDPLRRERAELYIATNTGIFPSDPILLGSELEGDATYSTTYTHDGKRVLAVNSLSGSVSVIDVENKVVEKIIQLKWYEIYHVAISPDDKWAIIGERLGDQASIIDLEKLEVVAEIPTFGDRPDQSFFSPDGTTAYILNAGSTDNISVIDFTQDPPKTIKNIVSGNMGISWINFGVRTNLAITDDGSRGVLATPFDDAIQIVDLEKNEISKSFTVENFPLRSAVSGEINGKVYAAVTVRNNANLWIIEDVTGNPVAFGGLDIGESPTQISYDAATKTFAVCSNTDRTISIVDPEFFEVKRTQRFHPNLTPIHVLFSDKGDQFTLLRSSDGDFSHRLMINDEEIELPGLPCHYFSISADGKTAAVPGLHTDEVYLIEANITGNYDLTRISLKERFRVGPNPFVDRFELYPISTEDQNIQVQLNNMEGRNIKSWEGFESPNLTGLLPGTYIYTVERKGVKIAVGEVVKR